MLDSFHELVCLFVSELPLSLPLPELQHEVQDKYGSMEKATFSGCLLLHRLLITGQEDEVLKRKEELSPSLLSHTCNFKDKYGMPFEKVSIEQLPLSDRKFPR